MRPQAIQSLEETGGRCWVKVGPSAIHQHKAESSSNWSESVELALKSPEPAPSTTIRISSA